RNFYIKIWMIGCLASLFFLACNGNPAQSKEAADRSQLDLNHALTKNPENYPVITVADSLQEFGKVSQGNVALYTFAFKNTGSKPLVIDEINSTCGCTIPHFSKAPIAPGQYGKIEIAFHSAGLSGRQIKPVFIHANTQPELSQLTITCNVTAPKK